MTCWLNVLSLICATVLLASSSALKWGDYCPNRNRCKNPKRHLVCLYHNDKKPIHRYCTSLKPARVRSFSKRDQTTTLDIINGFRANLAQGLIKVTNGRLKRAYGMIRLQWDAELAEFAQVDVNQCRGIKYDCAATAKHMNPDRLQFRETTTKKTINSPLTYFIKNNFKKKPFFINKDVFYKARRTFDRYLISAQGHMTHIGCGALQYVFDRKWYSNPSAKTGANIVSVVCYGSTTTRPGQPYFNTTRPVLGHGFTPNCGCPRNYREGDGCLCEEYFPSSLSTPPVYDKATHSDRKLRESTVLEAPSSAAPKACGRTVVLLPVIPVRPRPRVDPRPAAPLRPRFGDANKISSAKSRQDTSMLSNISEEQTETVPWVFNKIRRSQFNTAINKVNAFPKVLTSSPLIKDIILNNPFDIRNIMHRDQAQMRDSERFLHSNHEYINVQQNTDDRNVSRRVADENTYLKPLLDIVDPQRRQRQSEAGTTVSSLELDEY